MLCQHEGKWVLKSDRGHIIRAAHRWEVPSDTPVAFTPEFSANYGTRLQQKYVGHLEKARACKAILDQLKMPVDTFEGDLTEAEEEKILIDLRDSMKNLIAEVRDLRKYVTPVEYKPSFWVRLWRKIFN